MKRVLFTGGSGFIGRNIINELSERCILYTPSRKELDLLDKNAVEEYIVNNNIQVIIHSANPNPVKNALDKQEKMFEDSIRVFMNLYSAENHYEMMYTLGSGAEYDKSLDIDRIKEEEFGRSIPYDTYGMIKYTIHQIIEKSAKQCNLRLFAVYGPTDHESKFLTHVIRSILDGKDITIRQDCQFDYMQVKDLVGIFEYFINNKPRYNAYNIASGEVHYLSEIADMIKREMNSDAKIIISKGGYNNIYTADNSRLLSELGEYEFTSLIDGIKLQIAYEKEFWNAKKSG